ncbi:MAG: DUF481 domain-containing protein [Proteobacteria bacterium]|nr:DUF481 domain-containing protein [Pseudomonadota bacterium]
MKKTTTLTLFLSLFTAVVMAEDNGENKTIWSGKGQLGITATSGNTETETINVGFLLKRESSKWLSELNVDILRASSDGIDTAERFVVNTKTGYKFNEKSYLYYGTRYENDNFSGFDYTITAGLGLGHKFVDTDQKRLIGEIGVGYKTQALDIDRSETKDLVMLGKLDFMRQLTETVKFEDVLTVEVGDSNTFIQNDAGFSFKATEKISLKLAHQIRYNSDVPVGFDNTDTLISANLVYDF